MTPVPAGNADARGSAESRRLGGVEVTVADRSPGRCSDSSWAGFDSVAANRAFSTRSSIEAISRSRRSMADGDRIVRVPPPDRASFEMTATTRSPAASMNDVAERSRTSVMCPVATSAPSRPRSGGAVSASTSPVTATVTASGECRTERSNRASSPVRQYSTATGSAMQGLSRTSAAATTGDPRCRRHWHSSSARPNAMPRSALID